MASYQDLLDAIARVRRATGDRDAWRTGLSGEDVATACNPLSAPSARGAVLSRIIAAHPDAFLADGGTAAPPPRVNEGLAADAIRDAETALARQNSTAAQVDLQVVTAVLNAHAADAEGADELNLLQREIEQAVLSRTDLDTPAGAREFQRFLIGKLRDIRAVVDAAGLDATSHAALAAALASLYASSTPHSDPDPQPPQAEPAADRPGGAGAAGGARPAQQRESGGLPGDPAPPPLPADPAPPPLPAESAFLPLPNDTVFPPPPAEQAFSPLSAPPAPIAAMPAPAAPAWTGGSPLGGAGLPALADFGRPDPLPSLDRPGADRAEAEGPGADPAEAEPESADPVDDDDPPASTAPDPAEVVLPDGQTVIAPSPEVAAAITASIAGTPIPEAFRGQGIELPAPGSPVADPVDPALLLPGDIGILTDRHALALGDGRAFLDDRIRPITDVTGPGFLGWQHPPAPGRTPETSPEAPAPAPDRPVQTAPS